MNKRDISFPVHSVQDWEKSAEAALKGKPLHSIHKKTIDGIHINPLYTDRPEIPEYHPARTWKSQSGWKIAQRVNGHHPGEALSRFETELKKGTEVISAEQFEHWTAADAEKALNLLENPHVYLISKETAAGWHESLLSSAKQIEGVFGIDAHSSLTGDKSHENWFKPWAQLDESQPALRTIPLTAVHWHNEGAGIVEELAVVLSQAAEWVETAESFGWDSQKTFSKMHASFSTGSSFFSEIAKIRAFRVLWKHFVSHYGTGQSITIGSETSAFTKSSQDQHVNLLRAGNEAFAAVLAGVDYLYTAPHEQSADLSSQAFRAARNLQLILKEEMFLQHIQDPAGGSYYIEHLTKELAQKAWEQFCDMQQRGAYSALVKNGWLQKKVDEVWHSRNHDVRKRKTTIVGMNRYAEVSKNVTPANNRRTIGQSWDQLIRRVHQEKTRSVSLVTMGELKDYKPRADFVKGVFAAAGVKVDENDHKADVLIACGSNDIYKEHLPNFLSAKNRHQKLFAAGKVQDVYPDLDGSVYEGLDMIDFLERVLFEGKGEEDNA
ncbi:methylmalonyl-CoA mutase family protein [Jeotgalibacillus sp. R-1-5s-1]|uniref:methylmalonyl-CoA mutase family protein n=1 Tax=Jeotgalibacillus sp. R-1-5s-1 TaxID=2555897 RepID=UPI00141AE2FC|nr:methylmalonyl-CoA mutase family protein [Jeotgalibacillus sp. R-1-5s-1]